MPPEIPLLAQISILCSQGLSTRGGSDPGKPAWPEHFLRKSWNVTVRQSQLFPNVYQRIRQRADVHDVLKSWPAFLKSQGMLGGSHPIMLRLT